MYQRKGLESTVADPLAAETFECFSSRLLRISPGAEIILDAARDAPEEPVYQLGRSLFWLFGQTAEAQGQAAAALSQLEQTTLEPHQKRWKAALTLWQQRDFDRAAAAFEELTRQAPEDLLAAKACEFLYYILGQQHCGPRFLEHMERLRGIHENDPDYLAMTAFAEELCGNMSAARKAGERALELESRVPWAQHALEHVLLWEGNSEEAMGLMQGWVTDWEASARPIHSHNAWHFAVALLDRLDEARAWKIFHDHVWMKTPEMVVEQLDAISFLWRMEMCGYEVAQEKWTLLAPYLIEASVELFMPFASSHYAYALARAGENEALERLLNLVQQRSAQADPEAVRVWAPTGQPMVFGSAALGRGEAAAAARAFDIAHPRLSEIGGSDAQDDLFRFAHIDSLHRAGRKADALNALRARLAKKNPSPMEASLLTRIA